MATKDESDRLQKITVISQVMTGVKDVYFKDKEDKDEVVNECKRILMAELQAL